MKSFISILIGIIFLGSCNNSSKNIDSTKSEYKANSAVVLKIEGMINSNSCPQKIQKSLLNTPGIITADIDFAGQLAKISFDSASIRVPVIIDKIIAIDHGKYSGKLIQERPAEPEKKEEEDIIITTPKSKEELEEAKKEISV